MDMKTVWKNLLLVCSLVLTLAVSAQEIVIEREGGIRSNPTLVFQGVQGNTELSARILENLAKCGWFDVRKNGVSDYIVYGSASGNSVRLVLANGAKREIASFTASGSGVDQTAAEAVDAVLKFLFKIPGICRSKIVFSVETSPGKREIYLCDFNGRNIQQLTRNGTLSVEPVWTPDGSSIIYCFYGMSYTSLIQYRFDIGKSRRLTKYNGLNAGGEVSPDGKYVALVLGRENQVDLYVRPVDGRKLVRLTNDRAVEASPVWTADGTKICYVSDANGRPQLYLTDPFRQSAPVRMTPLRGSERVTPDYSSDGKLVFSAKVGGDYVLSVSKDGKTAEKIGLPDQPEVTGEGPSWAPDQRHVVIADKGILYAVDTWLGTKRRLLGGSSKVFQPDWSPLLTGDGNAQ